MKNKFMKIGRIKHIVKKNTIYALLSFIVTLAVVLALMSVDMPNSNATTTMEVTGTEKSGKGLYKDGIYEGAAAAYNGDITMLVEIKNGWISGLSVKNTKDDPEYLIQAKTLMPLVIEQQKTNIEAVSGATFSSYGILDAIDHALEKAL